MSKSTIKKILVIDDSVEHQQLLGKTLKKLYTDADLELYDLAGKGKPSTSFAWHLYDLLILDYDLGENENGLEWLRQFKTTGGFPPTIMLTASDNEELVVTAIKYGAHGFLRKTHLNKEKLAGTIESACKLHKEETEIYGKQKLRVHNFNKDNFFSAINKVDMSYAFFLVEISNYNEVNENLGLFGTNEFINFISNAIIEFISDKKINAQLARISDAVTAILVQDISDINRTKELSSELCKYFSNINFEHENNQVDFFVNIGVYHNKESSTDINEVLARAVAACREAKNKGETNFILKSDIEKDETSDLVLQNVVLEAIKNDRIQTLFQPLVNVSDTSNIDTNLLYQTRANIIDKDNNILEAKEFLPVLKKSCSLKKLDRWVIRYCISLLSKFLKQKKDNYYLFIKLSTESIIDSGLSDWLEKIIKFLKQPGLGKALIFEVDADDYLAYQQQTKIQFNKLRIKLHASTAISEIKNINQLEKCLKLEKFNYVLFSPEHVNGNKMESSDIEEITRFSKEHNAVSVATKIDTGEYLAITASAGTDYILGNFVHPPMEEIVSEDTVEG